VCTYTSDGIHICSTLGEGLRSNNDTSVTISTLTTQILVFNNILQWKRLGILGEIVDFSIGVGCKKWPPDSFRKLEIAQPSHHNFMGMLKAHRNQIKFF
jgi:hypothetical protein